MEFFLNELSLHNQFSSIEGFVRALQDILKDRMLLNKHGHRLYCKSTIADQPVYNKIAFKKTVGMSKNPDLIRNVMRWVDMEGPFWDDSTIKKHSQEEYFEYQGDVVTDFSLAEAAFLITIEHFSHTVSFSPSNFNLTPLEVIWCKDLLSQSINVPNFWDFNTLQTYLQEKQMPPASWRELIDRAKTEFVNLTFLDSVLDNLQRESFNLTIAERIGELLNVLNTLQSSFDDQGNRTIAGHELISNYFHGDNALFSDESDSNKHDFRKELTFKKPDCFELTKASFQAFKNEGILQVLEPLKNLQDREFSSEDKFLIAVKSEIGKELTDTYEDPILKHARKQEPIFCPFHGKIRHRVFRLHCSWPIRHNEPLYIAYIGPKITKA